MDYRERNYYIMNIHGNYDNKIKELRAAIPSLSFHKPYNHFTFKNKIFKKLSKTKDTVYDGDCITSSKGIVYIQQIASCRKSEAEKFEALFKSAGSAFADHLKEVDKDYFGQ